MSDLIPHDTHVTAPAEVRRLTSQNQQILARLEQGPATRRELTALALNVTARISDLRVALKPRGLTIAVDERPDGYSLYRIVEIPSRGHDLNTLAPDAERGRLW